MNIALVDDDSEQLLSLTQALTAALSLLGSEANRITTFTSAAAFLEHFHPGRFDLVFLDIYIDEENGVDLARKIRQVDPDVALLFCSTSNAFASESYEVRASAYMLKPVTQERLVATLRQLDLARIATNRSIRFPDGFRCSLNRLLYTEYSNHTIRFHLKNLQPHSIYMSHAEAEQLLLPHKSFFCINKGCIVNFAQVRGLSDGVFTMSDGRALSISRRRYKEVFQAYTQFHFDQLEEEVAD